MCNKTSHNHDHLNPNVRKLFQVLHEELSKTLSKVNEKSTEAEVDEAIRLVQQAKYDNKIWKSGLDISYKTFLANKPSPTMKSVLLSIL